jgi:hypothetical protein
LRSIGKTNAIRPCLSNVDAEADSVGREIDRWNRDHGYGPARIDPGFAPALKAAFEAVWLGNNDPA